MFLKPRHKPTYRGPLGELQMQGVDALQDLLGLLQSAASLLRQGAKEVPLVADALATRVHGRGVVVVQGTVRER